MIIRNRVTVDLYYRVPSPGDNPGAAVADVLMGRAELVASRVAAAPEWSPVQAVPVDAELHGAAAEQEMVKSVQ